MTIACFCICSECTVALVPVNCIGLFAIESAEPSESKVVQQKK